MSLSKTLFLMILVAIHRKLSVTSEETTASNSPNEAFIDEDRARDFFARAFSPRSREELKDAVDSCDEDSTPEPKSEEITPDKDAAREFFARAFSHQSRDDTTPEPKSEEITPDKDRARDFFAQAFSHQSREDCKDAVDACDEERTPEQKSKSNTPGKTESDGISEEEVRRMKAEMDDPRMKPGMQTEREETQRGEIYRAKVPSETLLCSQEMIQKSPREDRNAELLALQHGDELVAADDDYELVAADLKAIREEYEGVRNITVRQRTSTSTLILYLKPERGETLLEMVDGEHHKLNALNSWYGGRVGRIVEAVKGLTIHFSHIFDGDFICEAYSRLAEVEDVEPDELVGENSDITLISGIDAEPRRYVFSRGKGNAPAGEYSDWDHRVFDVTMDGEVNEINDLKAEIPTFMENHFDYYG